MKTEVKTVGRKRKKVWGKNVYLPKIPKRRNFCPLSENLDRDRVLTSGFKQLNVKTMSW